jgi:hypothetical protein
MYIKRRKGSELPAWSEYLSRKTYVEIRAVATWDEKDEEGISVECQTFLDCKKDLDRIPDDCDISIMFEDGTYVELPIQAFKKIFEIIPDGELTEAIYG